MKKIIFLAILCIIALNTTFGTADKPEAKNPAPAVVNTEVNGTVADSASLSKKNKLTEAEINVLVSRLNEIRDMDKKNLTAEQKRELKKEVKDIKQLLKEQDGVAIYLSTGAIIIILLLIIIL